MLVPLGNPYGRRLRPSHWPSGGGHSAHVVRAIVVHQAPPPTQPRRLEAEAHATCTTGSPSDTNGSFLSLPFFYLHSCPHPTFRCHSPLYPTIPSHHYHHHHTNMFSKLLFIAAVAVIVIILALFPLIITNLALAKKTGQEIPGCRDDGDRRRHRPDLRRTSLP